MKSKRRVRNNRLNRSKKYFGGSRNDGDKLNNDNLTCSFCARLEKKR